MKSSGWPTTPAHSTVPPWMVCGGQGVGVLEVLGRRRRRRGAAGAGVGAHEDVLLGRVDGDDRAAHAVVDRAQPVVATRDDAVTDGELVAGDVDALAQPAVALQLGADQRVEALAAVRCRAR